MWTGCGSAAAVHVGGVVGRDGDFEEFVGSWFAVNYFGLPPTCPKLRLRGKVKFAGVRITPHDECLCVIGRRREGRGGGGIHLP